MEGSTTIRFHSIRCPFCEVYELEHLRDGSARCASCEGSLDAELLSMIRQIRTCQTLLAHIAARSAATQRCESCQTGSSTARRAALR